MPLACGFAPVLLRKACHMRRYSRIALTFALAACACLLAACSGNTTASKVPAASYSAQSEYMQAAIDEAREGIYNNHGGPFGSVIVKDGKIIGAVTHVLVSSPETGYGIFIENMIDRE